MLGQVEARPDTFPGPLIVTNTVWRGYPLRCHLTRGTLSTGVVCSLQQALRIQYVAYFMKLSRSPLKDFKDDERQARGVYIFRLKS